MSSNDQLIILKNEKRKKDKFEVHHDPCVDNVFIPKYKGYKTLLKRFLTLIEAIKFAKEYCNEYPYVEYGFTIYDSALGV